MKYKVWIQVEHYPETDEEEENTQSYQNEEPQEVVCFDTLAGAMCLQETIINTWKDLL